jgi:uncharacterized protein YdhG (YjbR/CyaY superfamily)
MSTTPATIDEYLVTLPTDQREALDGLRATIGAVVPGARETISSGVPAFKHEGEYLVGFGAAKRHVALYVMRGSALEEKIVEIRLGEIEAKISPAVSDGSHPGSRR